MVDRTITTDLIGRDRMSSAFDSAGRAAQRNGSIMSKAGSVMKTGLAAGAVAGAAGLGLVGKFLIQGVKDAASYQKVLAKTAQVLKTTGGASGQTVKGIKDQAAALETLSGVDEELIVNSQNVLATFTNIRNVGKNKIFDQATKSALDMSVALGSDLQGASIQVGKALNDPIKGVSALSKVGVSFTQTQKDVIKKLVETGHTADAQRVILKELNKEFGGQAKAAGAGFEGQMARFQDVISDTGRSIGEKLLPKLSELAGWAAKKIPEGIDAATKAWGRFTSAFNGTQLDGGVVTALGSETKAMADAWGSLASAFRDSTPAIEANAKAVDAEGKSFGGLIAAVAASIADIGSFLRRGVLEVQEFGEQVQQKALQMVLKVQTTLGKMPDKLGGAKWRRAAAETRDDLSSIQAKLDQTNTKKLQGQVVDATTKLQRLGRQRPNPKVTAEIGAAQRKIDLITAKLRHIPDENVTVFIDELHRDRSAAPGRIGHRASGGPVQAGQTYLVGERGPEIFTAATSGRIIANGHTPDGIDASRARAAKAFKDGMKVGKAYGDGLFQILKGVSRKNEKHLLSVTERIAARLKNKIDAAMQQLADRVRAKAEFVASVKASIIDSGNITQGVDEGGNEAVDIIANLRKKVAQAKAFQANIKRLRKLGLGKTSLQQILDAGPEAGGATAAALVQGGKSSIDEVNKLQKQLAGAGQSVGNQLGGDWYNAGIQASRGLLKGLKAERKQLMKFARSFGKDFADEIRKALGIKSPSAVMAKIGRQTMQGWAVGIARGGADVGRAVTAVTTATAPRPRGVAYAGSAGGATYVTHNHFHVTQPLGTPSQIGDAIVTAMERRPAGAKRIPARAVG